MATIDMQGKATIREVAKYQEMCLEARDSGDSTVEINWAGSLGIDTSVLQLLLALSREKELCGVGDPGEAVREALALAGFDSNLKPISYPE
jgi:hypothetical protein